MVVRAELEAYSSAAKAVNDETLEIVRGIFPNASKYGDYLSDVDGIVQIEDLQELVNRTGLEARVKPFTGNAFFRMREGVEERLRALEKDVKLVRQELVVNGTVVQVHVPNFSLLSFNQVKVEEDCCTDNIQRDLDDGWRIICICPPLNERRPTYIMGKFVPEADGSSRSCR